MKKQPFETYTLDEPSRALRVYLDALLCEASAVVAAEDAARAPGAVMTEALAATVVPVSQPDPGPAPALAGSAAADHPCDASSTVAEPEDVSYPDWAQGRFQCLSFQVAGVTLAAPLEALDGIVELKETITELPGYAPWVLGLLPHRGQNVQVVDIAEIIMPDERRAALPPAHERVKYLVLIAGGKFGLAADSISEVLTLDRAAVRWRGSQQRRPWLAGTVIDRMCALLEMEQLCVQLRAGLKGA
ncbi:MAG: chemotaxis protein CheW [Gammaproteobacteria bacterium]|nr:chemotaxis protein CheW [Gammaproteobacteria bacterium]